ncbi:hypothetical protein TGMAS_210210 [Toxoplasma gondii MAS]|uniref:Uncharacterized protein n=2 Tax=Toxoplasma gondii TaxID=5811 RepID=A0A086PPN8_TOXGO|nr:hypothetical protein TGMAS_210210 [Toxoplasma gondii MAS]PUA83593.1 hypothetical protein TGBR9_210210 [Toxoplasma gondii TgCATBr9]
MSNLSEHTKVPCARSPTEDLRVSSTHSVHPPLFALSACFPQNSGKGKANTVSTTSLVWAASVGGSPVLFPGNVCLRKRLQDSPVTSSDTRKTSEGLVGSQESMVSGTIETERYISPEKGRDRVQGGKKASEFLVAVRRGVTRTVSQSETAGPLPSGTSPELLCTTPVSGRSASGDRSLVCAELCHVAPLHLAVSSTMQMHRVEKKVRTAGEAGQGKSSVTDSVVGTTVVVRETDDVETCLLEERGKLQGGTRTSSRLKGQFSSMCDGVCVSSSPALSTDVFWDSSNEDPEVRLPPHTWPSGFTHPTRFSPHTQHRQSALSLGPECSCGIFGGRGLSIRRPGVHPSSRCWVDSDNHAESSRFKAAPGLSMVVDKPEEGRRQEVACSLRELGTSAKHGILRSKQRDGRTECADGCNHKMPSEAEVEICETNTTCRLFGKAVQKDKGKEQPTSIQHVCGVQAEINITCVESRGRKNSDLVSSQCRGNKEAAESGSYCTAEPTGGSALSKSVSGLMFGNSAQRDIRCGVLLAREGPLAYNFSTSRYMTDPTVLCSGSRRTNHQDNSSLYSFGPFNYTAGAAVGAPTRSNRGTKIGDCLAHERTEGVHPEAPDDEPARSWPAMAFLFPSPLQKRLKLFATAHSRFKRTMIDLEQGKLRQPRASRLGVPRSTVIDCPTTYNRKLVHVFGRHRRSQLRSPYNIQERRYPADQPWRCCRRELSEGTEKTKEVDQRGRLVSAVHPIEHTGAATQLKDMAHTLNEKNSRTAEEAAHPTWAEGKVGLPDDHDNLMASLFRKAYTTQLNSSKTVASIRHTSADSSTVSESHDDSRPSDFGAEANCGDTIGRRPLGGAGKSRSGVTSLKETRKVNAWKKRIWTESGPAECKTATSKVAEVGKSRQEPHFDDNLFDNCDPRDETQNSEKICLQEIFCQDLMILEFVDETLNQGMRDSNEKKNTGDVACRPSGGCNPRRDRTSDSKQPKLKLQQYCHAGAGTPLPVLMPTEFLSDDSLMTKAEAQRGVQSSLVDTRKSVPTVTGQKRCHDEVRSSLLQKELSPLLCDYWTQTATLVTKAGVTMYYVTTQQIGASSERTDQSVSDGKAEVGNTSMRRTSGLETYSQALGEFDAEPEVNGEIISDDGSLAATGRSGDAPPFVETPANQHGIHQVACVATQPNAALRVDTLSQVPHGIYTRSLGTSFSKVETEEAEGILAGVFSVVDSGGASGLSGGKSEAKRLKNQHLPGEAERVACRKMAPPIAWTPPFSRDRNGNETLESTRKPPHPDDRWTSGTTAAESCVSRQDSTERITAVVSNTETAALEPENLPPPYVRTVPSAPEPMEGCGQKRSRLLVNSRTGSHGPPPDISAPLTQRIRLWPNEDDVEEDESGKQFLESLACRQRCHLATMRPLPSSQDDLTGWWGSTSGSDTEQHSHICDERTSVRAFSRLQQRQGSCISSHIKLSLSEGVPLGLAKSCIEKNERADLHLWQRRTPQPQLSASSAQTLRDSEVLQRQRSDNITLEQTLHSVAKEADTTVQHHVAALGILGLCSASPTFVPQAFQQPVHHQIEQHLLFHQHESQPNHYHHHPSHSCRGPQLLPRADLQPKLVTGSVHMQETNSLFPKSRRSSFCVTSASECASDRVSRRAMPSSRGRASGPPSCDRLPSFRPADHLEENPGHNSAALSQNIRPRGPPSLLADTCPIHPLSEEYPIPLRSADGRHSGGACDVLSRGIFCAGEGDWSSGKECTSCTGNHVSHQWQLQQNHHNILISKNARTTDIPHQPICLPGPPSYRLGGLSSSSFSGETTTAATIGPGIASHHGNGGHRGHGETAGDSWGKGLVRRKGRRRVRPPFKRFRCAMVPRVEKCRSRTLDGFASGTLSMRLQLTEPLAPHIEGVTSCKRNTCRRQQQRCPHRRSSSVQQCSENVLNSEGPARALDCPEQYPTTGPISGSSTQWECAPGEHRLNSVLIDQTPSLQNVAEEEMQSLRQLSRTTSPFLVTSRASGGAWVEQPQARTLKCTSLGSLGITLQNEGLGHSRQDPSQVPTYGNVIDPRHQMQRVEAGNTVQCLRECPNEVLPRHRMTVLETVAQSPSIEPLSHPQVATNEKEIQRVAPEQPSCHHGNSPLLEQQEFLYQTPSAPPLRPLALQPPKKGERDEQEQQLLQRRGPFAQAGVSVPRSLARSAQVNIRRLAARLLDDNASVLPLASPEQPRASTLKQTPVVDFPELAIQSLLPSLDGGKSPPLTKPMDYIHLATCSRQQQYGNRGQSKGAMARLVAPPSRSLQSEQRAQVMRSPMSMSAMRFQHQVNHHHHRRIPGFHLESDQSSALETIDRRYAPHAPPPLVSAGRSSPLSRHTSSAILNHRMTCRSLRQQRRA